MAYSDPASVPTIDPIRALLDSLGGQSSSPSAPPPATYGSMGPPAPQPNTLMPQSAPAAPSLGAKPAVPDTTGQAPTRLLSRMAGIISNGVSNVGGVLMPAPTGALGQCHTS